MYRLTGFEGRDGVFAWLALSALCAVALGWYLISQPFAVDPKVLPTAIAVYGLMGGFAAAFGVVKTPFCNSDKLVDRIIGRGVSSLQLFTTCYLFLAIFALFACLATYTGQAAALPLQDQTFADLDQALGFDFNAFHAWVGAHPMAAEALFYAYHSCGKQFLVVFLIGSLLLDREMLARFCALLALTFIPTAIFASLWPALGACVHHQPTLEPFAHLDPLACRSYLPHVEGLRDGSYTLFIPGESKGILTFPSFHAVVAVILTYSVRKYLWLLIPFAILNTVNVLATMPYGGHYFVDVLAGFAIAAVSIAIVHWNANWRPRTATSPAPASAAAVASHATV